MRRSLFHQFSIAAVVIMLIVSGASVASAADSAPDLSFSVTASPSGVYAVAGQDSWILQVSVTGDGAPADLPDPAGLTVSSASPEATVSAFTHPELGQYTAQVTTSVPDTYALSVQYNGLQISSPIIQFFSSGPDPAQSTLVAIPEQILATCGSAVVEDPVIATATVRDSEGTGIPGLDVVFEYGTDTPVTRTTDNDGVASAELFFDVPNVPTTKIVSASVNVDGASVDLPSASVEIEPEEGCSSEEVVLNWRPEVTSQVVGLSLRVLITALDVNGQITTIDATKLSVQTSSDDVSVGSPLRRFDGSYSVLLDSSTPGDYTVSVTYDGTMSGSPLPFSFVAPAPLPEVLPDLDQSYIYVSKWLADPGEQVIVTAVMKDSEGQGVDNAQVVFSMTGSDRYRQVTCMTLADGRCSIAISAPIPATFDILARFNGELFGAGQTVQFLGEDERDYQISMDVTAVSGGPMRADGYDSWEAWITILNPDDTPVTNASTFGLGLTVIDASNDAMVMSIGSSAFEAQPGGVYHTYLTSLVPGTYLVYAYFGWTWADPVTVSFSAVPSHEPGARLLLTRASALDNAVQVNENDREVNAQAIVHDEQGQPMSAVKVDFTVSGDEDVLSAHQCYTDEVGECSIRVWPNELGEHSVYASIANEPLIGSPATVRLVSSVYPSEYQLINLSEFTVSPAVGELVPADGVSQWVGTVTLTSPYGIDLNELSEIVEEMLTPSNPAITVEDVTDNDDNTYTVHFTSTQPGDFTVTAYYQGVAIERDISFSEAAPPTQSPSSSPSSPTQPPTSPPPTQYSTSASPSSSLTSVPPSSPSSPTQPPTSPSTSPSSPSSLLTPTQPPTSVSPSGPASPSSSLPSIPPSSVLTSVPPTSGPTSSTSTESPTSVPSTQSPTSVPSTQSPTSVPSTQSPTSVPPTQSPTSTPPTQSPTSVPPTEPPTSTPPTQPPTSPISPTQSPTNPPASSIGPTNPLTAPTQPPSGPSSPISPAPSSAPAIALSAITVAEGQTLRIAGANWVPGETVAITLYSTPISLGTVTANSDGTIPPIDVTIDLEAGQHLVIMEGSISGIVEVPFTVLASAPSAVVSSAAPAIPSGGTALQSPARWVLFGFLVIGAGLILTRKIIRQGH